MKQFHKGQIVMGNQDDTRNVFGAKVPVLNKGAKYVINDILLDKCQCTTAKWTFVWLGQVYPDNKISGCACKACKGNIGRGNKVWIHSAAVDIVETDIESATKMECEISLLKLLANGTLALPTFQKVMNLMNGDDEMVELGKQLTSKLRDG